MTKVMIIGAGGHGREVADILRHQQAQGEDIIPYGFIDDNKSLHGSELEGLAVLGDWAWLENAERENVAVICAVGLPEPRKALVRRAEDLGLSFANAISPLAYISPSAKIGKGVMIFPFAAVSTSTEIGDHACINGLSLVGHDSQIGPYASVAPGVTIAGNVTIGEGCWIGMGANVVQGTTIGEWSFITVGAAVVRDVPGHMVAAGVPARSIRKRQTI
jgi:sugar O-acyltransferase (sialic acid O-acetyltransferase NeuD family)